MLEWPKVAEIGTSISKSNDTESRPILNRLCRSFKRGYIGIPSMITFCGTMPERLDTRSYAHVFALDTQMVFEARPLDQLNWPSIATGPVLLLILPQVSSEIDKRKRDGRLGQRARAFNRQLEPSIETGKPAKFLETPVGVDLAYVAAGAIDWSKLDDLERDNGDDLIVAQALNALIDDPSRIVVLSFDIRPRAAARRHGLGAFKPDESWLLDPEPSPKDRRIAELEQRVKLLQTNAPELRVSLRLRDNPPLTRYRIQPLATEIVDVVANLVLAKHPREQTGGAFYIGINGNSDYDDEYDEYVANLRDRDIPVLHLGVARQFSAYGIEIILENTGHLAAEHVTVELRSGNAKLHAAPYIVDVFGPPPPSTTRDMLATLPEISSHFHRPDRTSFTTEDSDDSSTQVEYRCEDFRHGRSQTLSAILEVSEQSGNAAHVEVRVTAKNMRGQITARLEAEIVDQETALGELIDLGSLSLKIAPPTLDLLLPLLEDDPDMITHYGNDGTQRPQA